MPVALDRLFCIEEEVWWRGECAQLGAWDGGGIVSLLNITVNKHKLCRWCWELCFASRHCVMLFPGNILRTFGGEFWSFFLFCIFVFFSHLPLVVHGTRIIQVRYRGGGVRMGVKGIALFFTFVFFLCCKSKGQDFYLCVRRVLRTYRVGHCVWLPD